MMTDVECEEPTTESMTEPMTENAAATTAGALLNNEDELIDESSVEDVVVVGVGEEEELAVEDEIESNHQANADNGDNASNDDNDANADANANGNDELLVDKGDEKQDVEDLSTASILELNHSSLSSPSPILTLTTTNNDSSSESGIEQSDSLELEAPPLMPSIIDYTINADTIETDTHTHTTDNDTTDTDTTDTGVETAIPVESTSNINSTNSITMNSTSNDVTPNPLQTSSSPAEPMQPIQSSTPISKILQTQTTNEPTTNNNNNNSNNNNNNNHHQYQQPQEDEESKIAAQMAAVAAAATAATSYSESPSATANLAHTISATIAELPPPPPPPPPPGPPPPPPGGKESGGGRRKKRRRYSVPVQLVRQFLIQKVVTDMCDDNDDVGLGQSVEVELGQAVTIINVNQIEGDERGGPIVVAVPKEQHTTTSTVEGGLLVQDTTTTVDVNADSTVTNNDTADQTNAIHLNSTPSDATDDTIDNMAAEEQNRILTSATTNSAAESIDDSGKIESKYSQPPQRQRQRQELQIERQPFNPASTMSQLIINENNDYFLKILIMLSSFSCLPSKEDMEPANTNNSNSPPPPSPVSSNRIWSDSENKHASDAANQTLSLLEKAENSYEFLLDLLPTSSATATQANTGYDSLNNNNSGSGMKYNTGDGNTGSDNADNHRIDSTNPDSSIQNIELYNDASYGVTMNQQYLYDESIKDNDRIAEQEEDSYYGSGHIIPDLLPPCTSLDGDATAAFFQACKSKPTTAPPSPNSKNTSEMESAISTNSRPPSPDSPHRVPAPVPRASVTSSFVSSFVSSVKNSGSPGGAGNTLGGVINKVRGRRRGNKINASPTNATTNSNNKVAGGEGTSAPITPPRQQQGPMLGKPTFSRRSRSGTEYDVTINREMLGLTVENVLERTVVRTVLANGAAKKAGAKVGSLIVKVGSVETTNLTHFETIDELRQSQRPLKLVLRRISKDALKGAREEMGRLIRGGGFGVATMHVVGVGLVVSLSKDKGDRDKKGERTGGSGESIPNMVSSTKRQKLSLEKDAFMINLHDQWLDGTKRFITLSALTKKDEVLCKAGEKLIWILSLLVIGLEREAAKLNALEEYGWANSNNSLDHRFGSSDNSSIGRSSSTKHQHYTAKDYVDQAKSVSKILHDYVKKHFEKDTKSSFDMKQPEQSSAMSINRKRTKLLNPPPHIMNKQMNAVPGASKRNTQQPGTSPNAFTPCSPAETALLRIGDVLHRTRTFLADPFSEPAAMLRGEVIALLCDILDIDMDMTLSDEESDLPAGGGSAGGQGGDGGGGLMNDLGSAGSLLKIIVLNCSMMRSPDCAQIMAQKRSLNNKQQQGENDNDSHKAHAGNRFLAVVHRLAASRSTSARVTACSLGPVLWSHLDFPHQLQLRGVITRALHDVEVVVRKSTATVLHEIAELVFDSRAVPWLVLMCERAMTDPEPQLRAAAMTLTWHLAEHLPNAFYGKASEGSRSLRGLPGREDPTFIEVYLLQCKLLPVATRLAEDREASVRLAVAAQCDRLVNALGEHWYSVIIDLLQALLGDADDRVRSEAMLCMPRLVEVVLINTANNGAGTNLSVNVLESLLPVASKLLKDKSTDVRVSLAMASGELLTLLVGLPILEEAPPLGGSDLPSQSLATESENSDRENYSVAKGHKKHIDDALIPLLQTLLHDSDPEVTSAALRAVTNASRGNGREIGGGSRRNLGREDDSLSMSSHHSHPMDPVFTPVLSEKQVLRLLPTLSNLANSAQWRVRQSAVEIVPALLGCTHRLETRSEIAQLCITLMGDSVYSVRKTAAECLCIGGSSVGDRGTSRSREWISAIVIPHIEICQCSSGYKQRLLSLKMVEIVLASGACSVVVGGKPTEVSTSTISTNLSNSVIDTTSPKPSRRMLQIAASLSDDTIANVRLNVGRVYGNVMNLLEEDDITYVVTVLEEQLRNEWTRPKGADRDVIFYAKNAIRLANDCLVDCDSCE